nr:SDR family oxidoreductase [Sphingomonas colocasiae]
MVRVDGVHAGRTALVTGAARGIGLSIARALAQGGARVALVDRLPADEPAATLPGSRAFSCDLADPDAIATLLDEVAAWGRCDMLVHAAGLFPTTPADTLTLDAWRRVFAVNLDAAMLLAQGLAPAMRSGGWGRMVMISSGTIGVPRREVAAYVASKMGLIGLTRALASDLGADGITANAVAPGFVSTEGTREKFDRIDALASSIAACQSIPRLATPEEIASAVSFLCSDGAAMISGQTWMVDGGWHRL